MKIGGDWKEEITYNDKIAEAKLEKEKKLQKAVDKKFPLWYILIAVARDSKSQNWISSTGFIFLT